MMKCIKIRHTVPSFFRKRLCPRTSPHKILRWWSATRTFKIWRKMARKTDSSFSPFSPINMGNLLVSWNSLLPNYLWLSPGVSGSWITHNMSPTKKVCNTFATPGCLMEVRAATDSCECWLVKLYYSARLQCIPERVLWSLCASLEKQGEWEQDLVCQLACYCKELQTPSWTPDWRPV